MKLLISAVMMDNLAEEVEECSLNQGCLISDCLRTIGTMKTVWRYTEWQDVCYSGVLKFRSEWMDS